MANYRDKTLGELLNDTEKAEFLKLRQQGYISDELVPKFYDRFVRELENADNMALHEDPESGIPFFRRLSTALYTDSAVIRQNAFKNAIEGLSERNRPLWRGIAADLGSLTRGLTVDEQGEVAPLAETLAAKSAGEYVKEHGVFTPLHLLGSSVRTVAEGVGDVATGRIGEYGEHPLEHFAKIGSVIPVGRVAGKGLAASLSQSATRGAAKSIGLKTPALRQAVTNLTRNQNMSYAQALDELAGVGVSRARASEILDTLTHHPLWRIPAHGTEAADILGAREEVLIELMGEGVLEATGVGFDVARRRFQPTEVIDGSIQIQVEDAETATAEPDISQDSAEVAVDEGIDAGVTEQGEGATQEVDPITARAEANEAAAQETQQRARGPRIAATLDAEAIQMASLTQQIATGVDNPTNNDVINLTDEAFVQAFESQIAPQIAERIQALEDTGVQNAGDALRARMLELHQQHKAELAQPTPEQTAATEIAGQPTQEIIDELDRTAEPATEVEQTDAGREDGLTADETRVVEEGDTPTETAVSDREDTVVDEVVEEPTTIAPPEEVATQPDAVEPTPEPAEDTVETEPETPTETTTDDALDDKTYLQIVNRGRALANFISGIGKGKSTYRGQTREQHLERLQGQMADLTDKQLRWFADIDMIPARGNFTYAMATGAGAWVAAATKILNDAATAELQRRQGATDAQQTEEVTETPAPVQPDTPEPTTTTPDTEPDIEPDIEPESAEYETQDWRDEFIYHIQSAEPQPVDGQAGVYRVAGENQRGYDFPDVTFTVRREPTETTTGLLGEEEPVYGDPEIYDLYRVTTESEAFSEPSSVVVNLKENKQFENDNPHLIAIYMAGELEGNVYNFKETATETADDVDAEPAETTEAEMTVEEALAINYTSLEDWNNAPIAGKKSFLNKQEQAIPVHLHTRAIDEAEAEQKRKSIEVLRRDIEETPEPVEEPAVEVEQPDNAAIDQQVLEAIGENTHLNEVVQQTGLSETEAQEAIQRLIAAEKIQDNVNGDRFNRLEHTYTLEERQENISQRLAKLLPDYKGKQLDKAVEGEMSKLKNLNVFTEAEAEASYEPIRQRIPEIQKEIKAEQHKAESDEKKKQQRIEKAISNVKYLSTNEAQTWLRNEDGEGFSMRTGLKGYKIVHPLYKDVEFFIFKGLNYRTGEQTGNWQMVEAQTGLAVSGGSGDTRVDAIRPTFTAIENAGIDKFKELVEQNLEQRRADAEVSETTADTTDVAETPEVVERPTDIPRPDDPLSFPEKPTLTLVEKTERQADVPPQRTYIMNERPDVEVIVNKSNDNKWFVVGFNVPGYGLETVDIESKAPFTDRNARSFAQKAMETDEFLKMNWREYPDDPSLNIYTQEPTATDETEVEPTDAQASADVDIPAALATLGIQRADWEANDADGRRALLQDAYDAELDAADFDTDNISPEFNQAFNTLNDTLGEGTLSDVLAEPQEILTPQENVNRVIASGKVDKKFIDSLMSAVENGTPSKIIGQKVSSDEDVAALSYIARDPKIEKTSYFFLRDGEVVWHTAVSLNQRGLSGVLPASTLKAIMKIVDATHIGMVHNHPTGQAYFSGSPSLTNIEATDRTRGSAVGDFTTFRTLQARLGEKLAHFVVTNKNTYGFIGKDESGKITATEKVPFTDASPQDAIASSDAHHDSSWITIVGTNDNNEIVWSMEFESGMKFANPDTIQKMLSPNITHQALGVKWGVKNFDVVISGNPTREALEKLRDVYEEKQVDRRNPKKKLSYKLRSIWRNGKRLFTRGLSDIDDTDNYILSDVVNDTERGRDITNPKRGILQILGIKTRQSGRMARHAFESGFGTIQEMRGTPEERQIGDKLYDDVINMGDVFHNEFGQEDFRFDEFMTEFAEIASKRVTPTIADKLNPQQRGLRAEYRTRASNKVWRFIEENQEIDDPELADFANRFKEFWRGLQLKGVKAMLAKVKEVKDLHDEDIFIVDSKGNRVPWYPEEFDGFKWDAGREMFVRGDDTFTVEEAHEQATRLYTPHYFRHHVLRQEYRKVQKQLDAMDKVMESDNPEKMQGTLRSLSISKEDTDTGDTTTTVYRFDITGEEFANVEDALVVVRDYLSQRSTYFREMLQYHDAGIRNERRGQGTDEPRIGHYGQLERARQTGDQNYERNIGLLKETRKLMWHRFAEISTIGQTHPFDGNSPRMEQNIKEVREYNKNDRERALRAVAEALRAGHPDSMFEALPEFARGVETGLAKQQDWVVYEEQTETDAKGETITKRVKTDEPVEIDIQRMNLPQNVLDTLEKIGFIDKNSDGQYKIAGESVAERHLTMARYFYEFYNTIARRENRVRSLFMSLGHWDSRNPLEMDEEQFFDKVNDMVTVGTIGYGTSLLNLVESLGATQDVATINTIRGIRTMLNKEKRDMLLQLSSAMSNTARFLTDTSLGEKYFTSGWSLFSHTDKHSRAFGIAAGLENAKDLIRKYSKATGKKKDSLRRTMLYYNLNPNIVDTVVAAGDIEAQIKSAEEQIFAGDVDMSGTPAEQMNLANAMLRAGRFLSNEVFKRYDATSLPPFLMRRSPFLRLFTKFKSWQYQQNRQQYKRGKFVYKEAQKGNFMPAWNMAQGMAILGGTYAMMGFIWSANREEEHPAMRFINGMLEAQTIGYASVLLQLALRAEGNWYRLQKDLVSQLGGPAGSITAGIVSPIITGDFGQAGDQLLYRIPVANVLKRTSGFRLPEILEGEDE